MMSFREGTDWKILTIQPCDPRDPRVQVRDAAGRVTEFQSYSDAAADYANSREADALLFWHHGDKGWGEGCAPEFQDTDPMFSDDAVWWEEDHGGALIQVEEEAA